MRCNFSPSDPLTVEPACERRPDFERLQRRREIRASTIT
jgi:hypothetical protein